MTYVYEQLNEYEIADRLRADEYGGWDRDSALAMARWLLEYAEETGDPLELDVVANGK